MQRDFVIVDEIIIHCSDTQDGEDRWTIWDIDDWHRQRGFARDPAMVRVHQPSLPHVGYHRVYSVGGATWEGRDLSEAGAHATGHNRRSVGLCLIGRTTFTLEQWHSLRLDVEELLRRRPGRRVLGHRDVETHKTCPGFDVAAWLDGGMQPLEGHVITPSLEAPCAPASR